jgi:hypothetical protein
MPAGSKMFTDSYCFHCKQTKILICFLLSFSGTKREIQQLDWTEVHSNGRDLKRKNKRLRNTTLYSIPDLQSKKMEVFKST